MEVVHPRVLHRRWCRRRVVDLGAAARTLPRLRRRCRRLSLVSIIVGTAALIADLGRPSRFFNMLRVFRPTSPMSMGSWLLRRLRARRRSGCGPARRARRPRRCRGRSRRTAAHRLHGCADRGDGRAGVAGKRRRYRCCSPRPASPERHRCSPSSITTTRRQRCCAASGSPAKSASWLHRRPRIATGAVPAVVARTRKARVRRAVATRSPLDRRQPAAVPATQAGGGGASS